MVILAKVGVGEVDADGRLVPGTEQLNSYAGSDQAEQLLNEAELHTSYDIVFIDRGSPGVTGVEENSKAFVAQGGVLYLSDFAFQYMTEAFPGRVEIRGYEGKHGITTDAEVLTENSVGESFKNFGSSEGEPSHSTEGRCCRQADVYPAQWITSVKTLTVSFAHGAGHVLFTSYHTVRRLEPQPELHPQEVVLAGLVFERQGRCRSTLAQLPALRSQRGVQGCRVVKGRAASGQGRPAQRGR